MHVALQQKINKKYLFYDARALEINGLIV